MEWTREDELALKSCRDCVRSCGRYHIKPAPVYTTLLRAYEALKDAGLIRRAGGEPEDLCRGCMENVNGSCAQAYQSATLNLEGTAVVQCRMRRERRESA